MLRGRRDAVPVLLLAGAGGWTAFHHRGVHARLAPGMSMRAPWQWWIDRRPLGRIVDVEWVPAPQRLERTWAWLMGRPEPSQPPRRIVSLAWWTWLGGMILAYWVLPSHLWLGYLRVLQWVLLAIAIAMILAAGVLVFRRRR